MSLRYVFPCPDCEHKFELVTKQAGQDLNCPQCGKVSIAPKLGTMKQLETVGGEEPASKRASRSSGSWKNILFVCGLGLAIIAGASGYFVYQYAQSKITVFDVDESMDSFDEIADIQTPSSLIKYYESINVPEGLREWSEQKHVGENKQGAILLKVAYGLFGLAGLGLLLLIGSFLAPK